MANNKDFEGEGQMGESRRFTRIPYQSEVLMNAGGQWYRGISENLSLYGIYVKSNANLNLNSAVELTISLPLERDNAPEEYIDVNGRVVRNDSGGIGCEFQQVEVDAFLNLKNVIGTKCDDKNIVMDEFYSYLARKELQAF